MAEIEIPGLSGRHLDRRIADEETPKKEIPVREKERKERSAKAGWRFANSMARVGLKDLFGQVLAFLPKSRIRPGDGKIRHDARGTTAAACEKTGPVRGFGNVRHIGKRVPGTLRFQSSLSFSPFRFVSLRGCLKTGGMSI
jgi:hypothetical protein